MKAVLRATIVAGMVAVFSFGIAPWVDQGVACDDPPSNCGFAPAPVDAAVHCATQIVSPGIIVDITCAAEICSNCFTVLLASAQSSIPTIAPGARAWVNVTVQRADPGASNLTAIEFHFRLQENVSGIDWTTDQSIGGSFAVNETAPKEFSTSFTVDSNFSADGIVIPFLYWDDSTQIPKHQAGWLFFDVIGISEPPPWLAILLAGGGAATVTGLGIWYWRTKMKMPPMPPSGPEM